jgi:hypothetical protein
MKVFFSLIYLLVSSKARQITKVYPYIKCIFWVKKNSCYFKIKYNYYDYFLARSLHKYIYEMWFYLYKKNRPMQGIEQTQKKWAPGS